VKNFLLILFLSSCGESKKLKQNDDPLAARFKLIESNLREFANKAIIIQPHLTINGIDSSKWDFTNIAWLKDAADSENRSYIKNLLEKVSFDNIEQDIDQLLRQSEKNLREIKKMDLKN